MATVLKTKAEQRLEQLEALRRPLTSAESAELKRCLHAIYVRNKRLEFAVHGRVGGELLEIHKAATLETNAIANRMITARDDSWPIPHADDWQGHARAASDQLRDAILALQAREMVAA